MKNQKDTLLLELETTIKKDVELIGIIKLSHLFMFVVFMIFSGFFNFNFTVTIIGSIFFLIVLPVIFHLKGDYIIFKTLQFIPLIKGAGIRGKRYE